MHERHLGDVDAQLTTYTHGNAEVDRASTNRQTFRMSSNPFLRGNMAPVDRELTEFDLKVTGQLPPELDGVYVRNGPNPVTPPDPEKYHWFTGTGMVHGLRLGNGKAQWYRNRWVRSADVAKVLGEDAPPNPWPDDHMSFSANTNIVAHAGQLLACVEAGAPPVEMDSELNTLAISNLNDTLPYAFSAHPSAILCRESCTS